MQRLGPSRSANCALRRHTTTMWGRQQIIGPPTVADWRGVTLSSSKMHDPQQTLRSSRHSRSKSIDSLADLAVILSPTELLERAASEVVLYAGLAFKLFSYLGIGKSTPPLDHSSSLQCRRACD